MYTRTDRTRIESALLRATGELLNVETLADLCGDDKLMEDIAGMRLTIVSIVRQSQAEVKGTLSRPIKGQTSIPE